MLSSDLRYYRQEVDPNQKNIYSEFSSAHFDFMTIKALHNSLFKFCIY